MLWQKRLDSRHLFFAHSPPPFNPQQIGDVLRHDFESSVLLCGRWDALNLDGSTEEMGQGVGSKEWNEIIEVAVDVCELREPVLDVKRLLGLNRLGLEVF